MNTPLSKCHGSLGATQYSVAGQTHIRCTLNLTAACRQAGRGQGRSEEGLRVGGREQWEVGREEGTMEAMM